MNLTTRIISEFSGHLGVNGLSWWLRQYKESACSIEDSALIPELGRSPREGNGNPLQYSCLENIMGRGTWWATDHGVAELDMTEQQQQPLLKVLLHFFLLIWISSSTVNFPLFKVEKEHD